MVTCVLALLCGVIAKHIKLSPEANVVFQTWVETIDAVEVGI